MLCEKTITVLEIFFLSNFLPLAKESSKESLRKMSGTISQSESASSYKLYVRIRETWSSHIVAARLMACKVVATLTQPQTWNANRTIVRKKKCFSLASCDPMPLRGQTAPSTFFLGSATCGWRMATFRKGVLSQTMKTACLVPRAVKCLLSECAGTAWSMIRGGEAW